MKQFITLLAILSFSWQSYAQVTFTASAPKVVRQGQQFVLKFAANDDIDEINLPEVEGLTFLSGPSRSSSTSISIINGKQERKVEISLSYYVRIEKPGVVDIPSVKARIGKSWVHSNSLQVEALAHGSGSSSTQQSSNGQQSSNNLEDVVLRLEPSKRNVYVNEPIVLQLKIYTRISLTDYGRSYKEADLNGFYKEELETPRLTRLEADKYKGEIYNSGVVKSFVVFPQKSGKIVIDPFELEIQIQQKTQQKRSRSPFDDFFYSPYSNVWINYVSNPVSINVKPLPPGAPESFSGAVGKYNISSSIKGQDITTNDAVSLQLNISGTGNLKLVDEIPLRIPPTFESLEPQITNRTKLGTSGYNGTKTFAYTFIPRSSGSFTLPALDFTYFNPLTGKYVTQSTDEYEINVEKGEGNENLAIISGLSKEDVQYIGEDIRFIHTSDIEYISADKFLYGKRMVKFLYLVPLFIFLLLVAFRYNQIKQSRNMVLMKNKKASKIVRKRLNKAKSIIEKGAKEEFYDELIKALMGYLSDKLIIPMSELSKEKASEVLLSKDIDKEIVEKLEKVLDTCEFARYAPSTVSDDLNETYNMASQTIINIENKLR